MNPQWFTAIILSAPTVVLTQSLATLEFLWLYSSLMPNSILPRVMGFGKPGDAAKPVGSSEAPDSKASGTSTELSC